MSRKVNTIMENSPLCDVDGQCSANQSNNGSNSHLVLFSGCTFVVVVVFFVFFFFFLQRKEFSSLSLSADKS